MPAAELLQAQQARCSSPQSCARPAKELPLLRGQAQGPPPNERGIPLKRGRATQAPRPMAKPLEAQEACCCSAEPRRAGAWLPGKLPPLRGQSQGHPPNKRGVPLKLGRTSQAPRPAAELLGGLLKLFPEPRSRQGPRASPAPAQGAEPGATPKSKRGSHEVWLPHPGTQARGRAPASPAGLLQLFWEPRSCRGAPPPPAPAAPAQGADSRGTP